MTGFPFRESERGIVAASGATRVGAAVAQPVQGGCRIAASPHRPHKRKTGRAARFPFKRWRKR
ncbi:hypothetical protein C6T59_16505 [Burkholderia multivorans]|nr:hypothetical protein C6Q01_15945 [Burkholderia multivorans]PRF85279.1 hypothetical protein C6Q23_27965 [Burkholderia multivorans]PRG65301.1 hypothetical protein C6T59_16505 [Burkholderia multivorans]